MSSTTPSAARAGGRTPRRPTRSCRPRRAPACSRGYSECSASRPRRCPVGPRRRVSGTIPSTGCQHLLVPVALLLLLLLLPAGSTIQAPPAAAAMTTLRAAVPRGSQRAAGGSSWGRRSPRGGCCWCRCRRRRGGARRPQSAAARAMRLSAAAGGTLGTRRCRGSRAAATSGRGRQWHFGGGWRGQR